MNSETDFQTSKLLCHQCGSHPLAFDKFCRRCGKKRHVTFNEGEVPATAWLAVRRGLEETETFATAALPSAQGYRPISAPLVKAVTGSLPRAGRSKSRWRKGILAALISFPIWLLIVLLSPLDAYAAVRATVEQ